MFFGPKQYRNVIAGVLVNQFVSEKLPLSEVSSFATCYALQALRLSWPSLKSSSPCGGL